VQPHRNRETSKGWPIGDSPRSRCRLSAKPRQLRVEAACFTNSNFRGHRGRPTCVGGG
jgi:hypothetical protein